MNDGIKKDEYLDEQITLKYPTVDKLMEVIKKKGRGCMLFKRNLCHFWNRLLLLTPCDIMNKLLL